MWAGSSLVVSEAVNVCLNRQSRYSGLWLKLSLVPHAHTKVYNPPHSLRGRATAQASSAARWVVGAPSRPHIPAAWLKEIASVMEGRLHESPCHDVRGRHETKEHSPPILLGLWS